MDKQLKTEIRAILSARTATDADGWVVAVDGHLPLTIYGVGDSSAFYGIVSQNLHASVASDAKSALQKLSKAFQRFGTMAVLEHDPDALACVRRKCGTKTVLLTAKNLGEGSVLLTAYTGRSLLAKCTCRRALKLMKKALCKG